LSLSGPGIGEVAGLFIRGADKWKGGKNHRRVDHRIGGSCDGGVLATPATASARLVTNFAALAAGQSEPRDSLGRLRCCGVAATAADPAVAMATTDLDQLLSTAHIAQLRAALGAGRRVAGPGQALQVAAHARTLVPDRRTLRLAFVHTYTSDLLDPWLDLATAVQGFDAANYHAPYGLALQEASADSALVAHQPHLTVLLLQREDLHPDLSRPLASLGVEGQRALRAQSLQRLQDIVSMFRAFKVGHIVLSFLPRLTPPELGLYAAQSEVSETAWWVDFKSAAAAWLRSSVAAAQFLDLDEVLAQVGQAAFFDRRFWYSARFPFGADAAREVTRRIVALGTLLQGPRAKVLVLDADNTLWGGVVGEDGIDGIRLGPEYPGNLYLEFQRRILDFQQRGFILAMCSKNNATDVDQVLREHPHQVLRDEHFAARRVNWVSKPENLVSLAAELNLGLDSFIFVDDSDHECAAVRHALPQVEVVQVPSRPLDVPRCLDQVARLEVLSLTREDLAKTEMYAQERKRRELLDGASVAGGSAADYLKRLGMRMKVSVGNPAHLARLSQLTQKTNQYNLTTRRYDERQIQQFLDDEQWLVADFSLVDAFGDSGVVGLAMFRVDAELRARLDTFLMSCRVIGREAEAAFLHALLRKLADRGIVEVHAEFIGTAKNSLAAGFLTAQGFEALGEGQFQRDLRVAPPRAEGDFPIEIFMHVDERV